MAERREGGQSRTQSRTRKFLRLCSAAAAAAAAAGRWKVLYENKDLPRRRDTRLIDSDLPDSLVAQRCPVTRHAANGCGC
jgi:hypothetical protein